MAESISAIHSGMTIILDGIGIISVLIVPTSGPRLPICSVMLSFRIRTTAVEVISGCLLVDCIVCILRGDFVAYQYGVTPDVSRRGLDQLVCGAWDRTWVQSIGILCSNSLDDLDDSHGVVD